MNVLAFDTTLDVCSVAILDAITHSVLGQRHVPMNRGHAEALHGLIAEAMADAGTRFDEIKRIAVTTGPGTFTGSRIGIAAARGFALTLKVPVTGISTLQALAANAVGSSDVPILSALDARRGQIYAALYSSQLEQLNAPVALDIKRLEAFLPKSQIVGIGSGAHLAASEQDTIELSPAEQLPRASVWGLYAANLPVNDDLPNPLYLRPPDAKPPAAGSIVRRTHQE